MILFSCFIDMLLMFVFDKNPAFYASTNIVHPLGCTWVISVHLKSPVLSVLLLYSILAPGLVAKTVKINRQLGLTILKQGT